MSPCPRVPVLLFPCFRVSVFRKAKKFFHLDSEVDSKVRYRYQVLAFTLDGDYSTASNTAEAVWNGGP